MTYEQHELSAAFPSMSQEDFNALVSSVEKSGVLNPIVLFEGKVIDGWHRYKASEQLGKFCPNRQLNPDIDPRDFVTAQNAARRNLTGSQRAQAVVRVYEWKPAHRETPNRVRSSVKSTSEMAGIAKVSTRTIEQAKAVEREAPPEVKAAVQRGEMSVKAAAEKVIEKAAKRRPVKLTAAASKRMEALEEARSTPYFIATLRHAAKQIKEHGDEFSDEEAAALEDLQEAINSRRATAHY